MNFRSINDLHACITRNLARFPRDVDLVAGVPRSGLLPANLIALQLNKPLTDIDGLIDERLYESGKRLQRRRCDLSEPCRVLVVDDSIATGNQLRKTRRRLRDAALPHELVFTAIYVAPSCESMVDLALELVDLPRMFEWNVMHHELLQYACVDMDGVLCEDPTDEQNDDGPRYAHFLETAAPKLVPSTRLGAIVTCRLEKYRKPTEDWLARHGVEYDELIMMDLPDMAARQRAGSYGRFKAEHYAQRFAHLFIESSPHQAAEIVRCSGRPVLCIETMTMLTPTGFERLASWAPRIRRGVTRRWTKARDLIKKAA